MPLVTIEVELVRATSTFERGVLEQPVQPCVEPRPCWHLESAIVFENVVGPEHPWVIPIATTRLKTHGRSSVVGTNHELTGSNHDVRPSELATLFPQSGSPDLLVRTFKEAHERVDGRSELVFAGDLRGRVLCLEIAIEGGYENAVDVVGLEAYEGSRV